MSRIAILGGGGWGTGLSVVLAHSRRKHEIRFWVREADSRNPSRKITKNPAYLPGFPFPLAFRLPTIWVRCCTKHRSCLARALGACAQRLSAGGSYLLPRTRSSSAPPRDWNPPPICA